MAVFTVANRAQIDQAWAEALAGSDPTYEIALTGTEFSATSNANYLFEALRTGTRLTKAITFRAADPLNRPKIMGRGFSFRRYNGLKLLNLDFEGIGTEPGYTTPTGNPIPSMTRPIRFREFDGATIDGCRLDFYKTGVELCINGDTQASSAALVDNCEFRRISMDPGITRATLNGFTLRNSAFYEEAISAALIGAWHADMWQVGLDSGPGVHTDFLIQNVLLSAFYMKGFFVSDDQLEGQQLVDGVTVDNYQATTGRYFGLGLEGCGDVLVQNSVIRRAAGGMDPNTSIRFKAYRRDVTIANTVIVPSAAVTERPIVSVGTFSNNEQVDATGTQVPPGYVQLVRGVNCGVVSTVAKPAQMTNEATDGRLAANTFVEVTAGRFTRIARLPAGSAARAAVALNPENLQWRWVAGGVTEWQPFTLASPATSGGADRFQMAAASEGVAWTVGYAAAMAGITLRYRGNTTPWSDESTYGSNGDLSPAAPPVGTLDPLPDTRWGIHELIEIQPRFFVPVIWVNPVAGAPARVDWSAFPSTEGRPTLPLGTDGLGRTLWQFRPSTASGQDHVAGYDGAVSDTKVRYYIGEQISGWSLDAKTFNTPVAPAAPDAGKALLNGGVPVAVGGFAIVIPKPTRPATPTGYSLSQSLTEFTISGPSAPPFGGLHVHVMYAGRSYRIINGTRTVTKVPGHRLAHVVAFSPARVPSLGVPFRLTGALAGFYPTSDGGVRFAVGGYGLILDEETGAVSWSATPGDPAAYYLNTDSMDWVLA